VPDGGIVALVTNGMISQTLPAHLMPNTTYTLSVDVGHRLDGFATTYTFVLYAGNTVLKSVSGSSNLIGSGTFADETLSYTTGATVVDSGNLTIALSSAGSLITDGGIQSNFADVQLTDTAATPEPSSLLFWEAGSWGSVDFSVAACLGFNPFTGCDCKRSVLVGLAGHRIRPQALGFSPALTLLLQIIAEVDG